MSGSMFLTDSYDRSYLDPRLFSSRLSDEALEELWGPQVDGIAYHLVNRSEICNNGWLRGVAPSPSFLHESDRVYLPRFARIIERHLASHPGVVGRKVRVMPIYGDRGVRAGYPNDLIYMTEIPIERGQGVAADTISTVGEDIYTQLLEVAKRCLEHILGEGAQHYRWHGEWKGMLSLARVDLSYAGLPSFYTAMLGSIIEEMLKEQTNPALEDVSCLGWDSRDTLWSTHYPGFIEAPWVAYRIHPIPTIIS